MLDLQPKTLSIRSLIPRYKRTLARNWKRPRQRSKGKGPVACFTLVPAKVQLRKAAQPILHNSPRQTNSVSKPFDFGLFKNSFIDSNWSREPIDLRSVSSSQSKVLRILLEESFCPRLIDFSTGFHFLSEWLACKYSRWSVYSPPAFTFGWPKGIWTAGPIVLTTFGQPFED